MQITEIKAHLPIQTVLDHYHLQPDRNHRLLCPWHDDKTPSLQIYPKTNSWTCFSSNCNAGSGDVIEMIQRMERCDKHQALLIAKGLCGHVHTSILSRVAILTKYYQSSLHAMQRSKKGKSYSTSRGLDYDKLNIGYCGYEVGKTWNKNLQENAEKLGLYKIRNCLIFPTRNKNGKIVSVYGRSVSSQPKVKHFYLAKDETGLAGGFKGLYPCYPRLDTKKLILTESIIDAASIKQHTAHGNSAYEVLALYGTNGFTAEHKAAIKELNELKEVILFFDGDEAGRAAREKYHKQMQELREDIKLSYVDTPQGEDPNSLTISHSPEILTQLIESRLYFSSDSNRNESSSTEKKKTTPLGRLVTDNAEMLRYETGLTDANGRYRGLHITILGGIKITGLDRLRVTLKIERQLAEGRPCQLAGRPCQQAGRHSFLPVRSSLDLYHSRQVELLAQKIADSLEIGSAEAECTIIHMTGALENYRQHKLAQLKPKTPDRPVMTEEQRKEAIAYLKDPKLLENTLADIARSGIVGETDNALIAYLAYTSRKREKPLHIMYLGASGMGKTYLQEKLGELMPEEEKIEITSLSDNALYYFGREELKHKLILIEDLDGANNVLYPLRELQTKRSISKTVTLKDNKGNLKTVSLVVEGPVCVSGCTTRERIYEDNANRCILLYIDDSNEQDKRIMAYQQRVSAGTVNTDEEGRITEKLKCVQRCLRPVKVVNPYAELIDLPQEVFKPRRTLLLLLSFIETITFYHQWQRPERVDKATGELYIESTREDVETAFRLMKEVLFSKSDELTKASRQFLERLKREVKPGEIFYSKPLRKRLRIAPSTLKRYLIELNRHSYVKIKGGSKYRGFEYEICDYEEYEKLTQGIDRKLQEILAKIDQKSPSVIKKSGPVAHQWPSSNSEPVKQLQIS